MTKYVAFLRGINVNGTAMKMADVRLVFESSGMLEVDSVLATGNLIFKSLKNKVELKVILQNAMSKYFNYEAFMFVKTSDEVQQIFENLPFERSAGKHHYVFVAEQGFEEILIEEFNSISNKKGESGSIADQTFYWEVAKGSTLESEFGKILGKKSLKSQFTSRNINTFEKIIKKL